MSVSFRKGFIKKALEEGLTLDEGLALYKEAFEPFSLLAGLGMAAKGALSSKALNSATSYLMRDNKYIAPFFKNHYQGMSQLGWRAGMNPSQNVLPAWRKTLGMLFPTQSGVMDYEFSKNLAQVAKEKGMPLPQVPYNGPAPEEIKSPLMRNFLNSSSTPIPSYLDSLPKGEDTSGPGHFAKAMAMSTAMGSPHGAGAVALDQIMNAHDTGLSALYGGDKLNTITNLKAKIMSLGKNPNYTGLNSAIQPALKFLDPAMAEFHQGGRDLLAAQQSMPNPNFKPSEWDYDPSGMGKAPEQANSSGILPAQSMIHSYIDEEAAHPIGNAIKQDLSPQSLNPQPSPWRFNPTKFGPSPIPT